MVSSSHATHNGGFNVATGSNGLGYQGLRFSRGRPGANDVSGDPQFVDSTRSLQTWDGALGGPGTVANALAELRKRTDPKGYNARYTVAALLAWVKAGFAPRNRAYKPAHDTVAPSNGWIGAIEGRPGDPSN